ncbi:MAG: hypothetical protein AB1405_06715 [Bdellovibrionota bacterium]
MNVPYDAEYEPIFLALIAGLVTLGFRPRAGLEFSRGNEERLRRIWKLLQESDYSIHDLSRVTPSKSKDGANYPRFNMPFEAGLGVACKYITKGKHGIVFLEARGYRLDKTSSDLKAFDPHIHEEKPSRVLEILRDIFHRKTRMPSREDFSYVHEELKNFTKQRKKMDGHLFESANFGDLIAAGRKIAGKRLSKKK